MKARYIITLLSATFILTISRAQTQTGTNTSLRYSDSFEVINKDAMWLAQYDMTAWITSDSVKRYFNDTTIVKRLGKEWFCYVENDEWHAIYGNNHGSTYDQVFHFVIKRDGTVSQSPQKIDTSIAQRYSRAITLAISHFNTKQKSLRQLGINWYVRFRQNDTLQVWIFPAMQPNTGLALYGFEENYLIDPSGKTIIKDMSYYQDEIKAYKPDKNEGILLLNLNKEEPTLGGLFFVWDYKRLFKNIAIKNKQTFSFLMPQNNGKLTWVLIPQTNQNATEKKE